MWADRSLSFLFGGSCTPAAPNYIFGWFVLKADDTNFEVMPSNAAAARDPDFVIPLLAAAYAANGLAPANGLIRIPSFLWKVQVWSQVGATLPASGNKLILGTQEVDY